MVRDGAKALPFKLLRDELFNPNEISNIESDFQIEDLGIKVSETTLQELCDRRKANHHHVSSVGGCILGEK